MRIRSSLLTLALGLLVVTGCADGPMAELAALNPWIRKEWAEDQKFGPTFHEELAQLKAIREQAPNWQPAQQQKVARELSTLVRNDTNPLLREAAVKALGNFQTQEAVVGLQLAMVDSDRSVRIAGCDAWARFGGDQALQSLVHASQSDEDIDVRMAATRGLANFDHPQAVQALGKVLDDPDPAMQFRAVQSLKGITGKDYGGNLVAWRQFVRGENPPEPPTSIVLKLRELF